MRTYEFGVAEKLVIAMLQQKAADKLPLGSSPPPSFWGARFCQKKEWLMCPTVTRKGGSEYKYEVDGVTSKFFPSGTSDISRIS